MERLLEHGGARVEERPRGRSAGVVDDDVDAPELVHGLVDKPGQEAVLVDVAGDDHRPAAGCLDILGDLAQLFLGAGGDHHVAAHLAKGTGDGGADATPAARNDRGLPVETQPVKQHPGKPTPARAPCAHVGPRRARPLRAIVAWSVPRYASMTAGSSRTFRGAPRAITDPRCRHTSSSAIDEISGMSCSTMTSVAPVRWRRSSSSVGERLALALGDPRRRLVEQQDRRVVGDGAGEVEDAPGAGRQLGRRTPRDSGPAPSPRAARRPGWRHPPPSRWSRRRGSVQATGSRTSTWRSNATASASATVIDGNRRASWNDRPRPSAARSRRGQLGDVVAVEEDPTAVGRQEPRDDVEQRGLAGAVGADETDDAIGADVRSTSASALTPPKPAADLDDLERRAHAAARRCRCPTRPRPAASTADAAGHRPKRPLRSRPGSRLQLDDVAGEAHVAAVHERGPLGDRGGDVHRLLDDHDGDALGVEVADDVEERGDHARREAERELVDHQQLGLAQQGLRQRRASAAGRRRAADARSSIRSRSVGKARARGRCARRPPPGRACAQPARRAGGFRRR